MLHTTIDRVPLNADGSCPSGFVRESRQPNSMCVTAFPSGFDTAMPSPPPVFTPSLRPVPKQTISPFVAKPLPSSSGPDPRGSSMTGLVVGAAAIGLLFFLTRKKRS